MSATLFGRTAVVIIGSTRISDLRITFAIAGKDTREANKATITITNLSAETRARFEEKGLRVVLEAGLGVNVAGIFLGTSYRTTHKQSGADIVTTIEAADGGKEISSAKGSWSYGPRRPIADVVGDVVRGLGLPLSTGSRINPNPATFQSGWAFVGSAADAMDAVTKAAGLTWSVRDGQVLVLDAVPGDGTTAVVLSAATGLYGSPERVDVKDDKTGVVKRRVNVKCAIIPRIKPSSMVSVSSLIVPALSGLYVVKAQKVTGDTHGPGWEMDLELAPAAAR